MIVLLKDGTTGEIDNSKIGEMVKIDLTEAQKKLEKLCTGMGF